MQARGPIHEAGRLTLCVLALALLAVAPAWLLAGRDGLEGLAWSVALCLIPGVATIAIAHRMDERKRHVFGMLLGTGLRLGVVLSGAVGIAFLRPELRVREFFVWLVAFYLIALVLETRWLLADLTPRREAKL
ncbi:MAG: hypothetical protein KY476_18060 [Planctomycetes bacterium]|nr:hypothetical protein [Planctomycetota bacterium]